MWLSQVIGELERERAMRVYVFPRLIKDGKLTTSEAALRLERFDAAITILQELVSAGVATVADIPIRLTPPPSLKGKGVLKASPIHIKGCEQ